MKQPVVAFYDVEAEIYARAKQQAEDTANDPGEDEDEDDDSNEDRGPIDKDGDFELDDDIDLSSPFLHNMVSERPVPNFTGLVAPVVATHLETNRNATTEEWDNM